MESSLERCKQNVDCKKENGECLITDEKGFALNLTVFGTSAPVSKIQPKNVKGDEKYKPRRSSKSRMKEMESNFPVDKIIFLAEKLELTDEKIEFVASSMEASKSRKVGNRECDCFSASRENTFFTTDTWSSGKVFKERSAVLSPDVNFSIDLSSLAGTNDESDESCHELEDSVRSKESRRSRRVEAPTTRELEVYQNHGPCVSARRLRSTGCCSDCTPMPGTKTGDLISLYMSGVGDPDNLTKYLRPCPTCDCICECSAREGSSTYFWNRASDNETVPHSGKKINIAVETEERVTRFGSRYSVRSPHSKSEPFGCGVYCPPCCSSFSSSSNYLSFEDDRGSRPCTEGSSCCCEFGWSKDIESHEPVLEAKSEQILTYASSLANAARSARILARDLESVLSTFSVETSTNRK